MKKSLNLFVFLTIILVLLTSCRKETPNLPDLTFVQITDSHMGKEGYQERISRVVQEINRLDKEIDFVVLTGDFLDRGEFDSDLYQTGMAELNQLEYPLHIVAGGRDIVPRSESVFKRTMKKYKDHLGNPVNFTDYKGRRCIFSYVSTLLLSTDYYGFTPLSEIEEILKTDPGIPVILFVHEPPLEHPNFDEWTEDALNRLSSLNGEYEIQAILSGHWHQDAQGWYEDIPVYVSDSVFTTFSNLDVDSNFRLYTLKGNKLSYQNFEVDI